MLQAQTARGRAHGPARSAMTGRGAVLALARVTSLTDTGLGTNGQPAVRVTLSIRAPGVAFDTAAGLPATAARRANLDAGLLVVLVDLATRDFRIDWERSAVVNGLVPARFPMPEDNTTYDLTGCAEPLLKILQVLRDHDLGIDHLTAADADPAIHAELREIVRASGAPTTSR